MRASFDSNDAEPDLTPVSTSIPTMVAPDGMENPKLVHFKYCVLLVV